MDSDKMNRGSCAFLKKRPTDAIMKAEGTNVNEKFWDLKKTKQDNMINGSLKVFAASGFRRASTDEIVSEASVSKGLLFHYFYSKTGLYEFLTEYSARFALVELSSEIRKAQALPFFELHRAIVRAQARVMRQYPYLFLFLEMAAADESSEVREEALSNISLYTERLDELFAGAVLPDGLTQDEAGLIRRLIHLGEIDTVSSLLRQGSFSAEKYVAGVTEYINLLAKNY